MITSIRKQTQTKNNTQLTHTHAQQTKIRQTHIYSTAMLCTPYRTRDGLLQVLYYYYCSYRQRLTTDRSRPVLVYHAVVKATSGQDNGTSPLCC